MNGAASQLATPRALQRSDRDRKEGWGKEAIRKKKKLFWEVREHLFFCSCFEGKRPGKGFVLQMPLPSGVCGGGEGPPHRQPHWPHPENVTLVD